jgi:predicted N-acetyltransferase YhbS
MPIGAHSPEILLERETTPLDHDHADPATTKRLSLQAAHSVVPASDPPVTELSLVIRPELPIDAEAIDRLHERAFGPGRFARTAFRLREGAPHLMDLSFTALVGTLLVGSVRLTPVVVGGEGRALMLGPLTVEPAFENRGIGAALMRRSLKTAKEKGHALVLLVGDEPYYSRFGFKRIPPRQLELPGPVNPDRFLALELVDGALAANQGPVLPLRTGGILAGST